MKIIYLISGGDVGGAKTHVLSLLSGLNRTATVHLVCFTEGAFAQEARQLGIPTTVIEGNHLGRTKKRILAMLRHDGYDIMHCHGARANMMGMLLRRQAKIPLVSTVHSDYRLDYLGRPLAALTFGNINKYVLPRFDAWIAVSHDMATTLAFRGFDPQRIYTIHNGVDFSAERPVRPRAEVRREMGFDETNIVFGIAARLDPVKDMTTLILAFSEAVKVCPSIRLAIAGEGLQCAELRALAEEKCPSGTVHFAGWVKEIDSFYHALDVNCLTSLSEGFPYALPEGARMHCATISSEVGGVPYLIDDGKNGLLFRPQDVKALTEHMIRLASDAALRKELGDALYEKTKREFSLQAMIDKQLEIYRTILRRAERKQRKSDGVMICGAYGMGNSGDNTILSIIVSQLRHIDPDLPITVLSRKPSETRVGAGVDALYTFGLRKIGRRMKRCSVYLSGGGTLMQDVTSIRSLLYYLYSIRQASKKGCHVMLYGCGIGPISKKADRRLTARTLNRYAEVISVRDRYSEDYLRKLGVTRPNIRLTADPALLFTPSDDGASDRYLRRCDLHEDEKYLMLAVRPWEGFHRHIADFAEAAEYAREAYGLIPILYCMEPKRDGAAARAIAEKLKGNYHLLSAGSNGNEVLALVRRMSLVVSMRLHTLIFAAGQSVPMVGVVYDPKVSAFLDALGQSAYLSLKDADCKALCRQIDIALRQGSTPDDRLTHLRALAAENELLLQNLLKNH